VNLSSTGKKKCPQLIAGKPKIGPRVGNSEWRAVVESGTPGLRSRISVACMADERSIGRQCDASMTKLKRPRDRAERKRLGLVTKCGTKKSPLVKAG
jgi:hypothetical protein